MSKIEKEGTYNAKVVEATLGETEKGTPYVGLRYETESGETISHSLYLSDAAFERTVKNLKEVLGFDGNFEALNQLVGKPCAIVVGSEEYNDESRLRVNWLNKQRAAAPASFAQTMTARACKLLGTKPSVTQFPKPSAPVDADNPF